MSATKAHDRQMKLLRKIARETGYSNHTDMPLSTLSKELRTLDGTHLPQIPGAPSPPAILPIGPDPLAKDLLTLQDATFITLGDDSLVITQIGLARVRDLERSWLSKAIERQPITFVQVLITIIPIAWTACLNVWVWSQIRNIREQQQQTAPKAPPISPTSHPRSSH